MEGADPPRGKVRYGGVVGVDEIAVVLAVCDLYKDPRGGGE